MRPSTLHRLSERSCHGWALLQAAGLLEVLVAMVMARVILIDTLALDVVLT